MGFTDYLKSKSSLLLTSFLFLLFALFVNYFKIKGKVWDNYSDRTEQMSWMDSKTLNLFTDSPGNELDSEPQKNFWPFVKFMDPEYKNLDGWEFRGVFFQFDISEFLAYSVIIITILFFRWKSLYPEKQL